MSVHMIYRKDGGAKFMRPVLDRDAYLSLRNGGVRWFFSGGSVRARSR